MAFSVFVEMLNLRLRKGHGPPVKLHEAVMADAKAGSVAATAAE